MLCRVKRIEESVFEHAQNVVPSPELNAENCFDRLTALEMHVSVPEAAKFFECLVGASVDINTGDVRQALLRCLVVNRAKPPPLHIFTGSLTYLLIHEYQGPMLSH